MNSTTVAVDLAKNVFELAVADAEWRIVERHRLNRARFVAVLCAPCTVPGGHGSLRQCALLGAAHRQPRVTRCGFCPRTT